GADGWLIFHTCRGWNDPTRRIEGRARWDLGGPFDIVLGAEGYKLTNEPVELTLEARILAAVAARPGLTSRAIRGAVKGADNREIDRELSRLVTSGKIRREVKGRAKHHYPAEGAQFAVLEAIALAADTIEEA